MLLKAYVLLLLFFHANASALNDTIFRLSQLPSFHFAYVKNVIREFQNFHIIFHVDNRTQHYANNFLAYRQSDLSISIIIYNHDLDTTELIRPVGLNCFNIVAFNNLPRFSKYLKHKKNVMGSDVIMFITSEKNMGLFSRDFWFMPYLERAGNVIVVNIFLKFLETHTICFYCGVTNGKLIFQQRAFDANMTIPTHILYPRTFRNFKGQLMKVAYIDYYPYIYCLNAVEKRGQVICKKAIGSEYSLLLLLSQKMNFTFQLMQAPNESYSLLFDELVDGVFDFAIGGLSMTVERSNKLHFSNVIRFESIVFMFSYQFPVIARIFAFLAPLPPFLWIGTTLVLLVITLCFYYVSKLSTKWNRPFFVIFGTLAKAIIEQPSKIQFIATKTRITVLLVLSTWWIFAILVNTCYKSKLSSLLIHPPMKQIDKLQDVLDEGYKIVMDEASSGTYAELFDGRDKELFSIRSLIVRKSNLCENMDYIRSNKATLLGEFARLSLHAGIRCKSDHNDTSDIPLKIAATPLTKSAHGWPFKSGAAFNDAINNNLKLLINGKFMEVWEKDVVYRRFILSRKMFPKRREVIGVGFYISHLSLYAIGISLSIVCFLFEILYNYWKIRKIPFNM